VAETQFRFRYVTDGGVVSAVLITGKDSVKFGTRGSLSMPEEEWKDFMNKLKRSGQFQFIESK
jgi:hypothetical protein